MIRPDSFDLDALLNRLTKSATSAGLLVLTGSVFVDHEHYPTWYWSGDEGAEEDFIAIAHQVGSRVLYAHASMLEIDSLLRSELKDAYLLSDTVDEDEDDDELDQEPSPDYLAIVKTSLRHWARKDGQTYAITMSFFHQGVAHILFVSSEWFERLGTEITETIANLKEQTTLSYQDAESKRRAQTRAHADMLARDERFGRARNDEQRQIVTQEMFPELGYAEIRNVVAVAKYIFQDEVAPQQEKELAQRAKTLQAEGETMTAIAAKLGVTKARVERLLYIANQDS